MDRGRRSGRGVPAPAARSDPAGPRRRGRLPAGRAGLAPVAGQPVRRLLRGPAAADDRALQALRRDRWAAVHPGAGCGRMCRAGARGRCGGTVGRRRARRALDRGRDGRAQHQRAHRRGGGEGRAARAPGADGQPRAVAGGGPRPVLARGARRRAPGRAGARLQAEPRRRCRLRRGPLHRVVAGRAAHPLRAGPAGWCRVGGVRGPGGGHGRVGAGGRRTAAHAVVRRLRLPLRRQPGPVRRHRYRTDASGPGCWSWWPSVPGCC